MQAGNHSTFRGRHRLTRQPPEVPFNFKIEVLHVPFRSRVTTENPVLLERAIGALDQQPGELNPEELKEHFRQIWSEVSLSAEEQAVAVTDKGNYLLFADDALNRILKGIVDAGFNIDDPWCSSRTLSVPSPASYSSRVIVNEPYFDLAITALSAQLRRMDEQSSEYSRLRQSTRATFARLTERVGNLRQVNARLRQRLSLLGAEELSRVGHIDPVNSRKTSLPRTRQWSRLLRQVLKAVPQRYRSRRHRPESGSQ